MKPSQCEKVTKITCICHVGKEDGGNLMNCQKHTRPTVCRSIKLLPLTVSTIMKNADTIKQSVQHAMTISMM